MLDDLQAMRSTPKRGEVRVGSLYVMAELLREQGVDPAPLLATFGLSEAHFANPDNTLPFTLFGKVLAAGAEATRCPHFGLLVGQRCRISALGVTGFLAGNAPNVGTALNELITHYDLHNRAATPTLTTSLNRASLGFEIFEPDIAGAEHIHDGAVAVACNIMRTLCGPDWKPLGVCLRRPAPADASAYRRFFRAPVTFASDFNAIQFPSVTLQAPVASADPFLRHHFRQHVERVRQYADHDFRARAHRQLVLLLGAQECTLEHLARQLAVHPRTLNRRLREAGTSFREMHNAARHASACQMLRQSSASIEAIATTLGFSAVSSFNRAFSSWEGMPPATWRKHIASAE